MMMSFYTRKYYFDIHAGLGSQYSSPTTNVNANNADKEIFLKKACVLEKNSLHTTF